MSLATQEKLMLYTDDSGIIVLGKSILDIEKTLSRQLQNVSVWLVKNKLSLHLGKTESIVFCSKHKSTKNPKLNIECNDVKIVNKTKIKYLGETPDQCLTGEPMGQMAIKKINSKLKFLYRTGA